MYISWPLVKQIKIIVLVILFEYSIKLMFDRCPEIVGYVHVRKTFSSVFCENDVKSWYGHSFFGKQVFFLWLFPVNII